MSFFSAALQVFFKDLRVEARSKEIVSSAALFAVLTVLLCAFGFGLNTLPPATVSAGVIWIAAAFAGVLAVSRTYLRERELNVFRALLLSPAPRAAIYVGKMLGLTVFLLCIIAVLLPVTALFFHAPIFSHLPELLPVILLTVIGYAALGALFGAMTIRTRLRDVLLGVILYPLLAPLLISAVKATETVLLGDGLAAARDYLELSALIDLIYGIGGLWLFGPLMEE